MDDPSYDDQTTELFDPAVGAILHRIKSTLREVFPGTIWAWENQCRSQPNHKATILHWLRIAQLYRACRPPAVRGQPHLTSLQREAAFSAIIWCYDDGPERALDGKEIRPECLRSAEAAVRAFHVGPSEQEKAELDEASATIEAVLEPAGEEGRRP